MEAGIPFEAPAPGFRAGAELGDADGELGQPHRFLRIFAGRFDALGRHPFAQGPGAEFPGVLHQKEAPVRRVPFQPLPEDLGALAGLEAFAFEGHEREQSAREVHGQIALGIGQLDLFSTLEMVNRRPDSLTGKPENPLAWLYAAAELHSDLLPETVNEAFSQAMANLLALHRSVLVEAVRHGERKKEEKE